jgi:hypothetical protein
MQELGQNTLLETARELGPWVLSAIAIVQVWLIEAWRGLRKGRVVVHRNGPTEVGFSNFGPTVGVYGTLECVGKPVFVKELTAGIRRLKDGATHDLGWRAIRPTTMKLKGDPIEEIELASSFLLRPEDPYRFNVLFNDSDFVAQLGPAVNPVSDAWYDFRSKRLQALGEEYGDRYEALVSNDALANELFSEFSKEGVCFEAWKRLGQEFYWHPGEYRVELRVVTSRPAQVFTQRWAFSLSQGDSESLEANRFAILRTSCDLPAHYFFAVPESKGLEER